MKYKAARDIPKFIREYHTFSPSEIAKIILKERNKEVTPEAVTMWMKRHVNIVEQLKGEVVKEQLPELEVDASIFENGTFEELASVKKWIETLQDRHVKPNQIQNRITCLKRVCKGYGLVPEEWSFKHPDRITEEDFKEYNRKIREKGMDDQNYRSVERNFLMFSQQVVPTISGHIKLGQYADLYIEKPRLNEIFYILKQKNDLAYRASKFSFKTGSRENAVLTLKTKNVNIEERNATVFEKRKARQAERREVKYLDDELIEDLKPLLEKGTEYVFEGLTAEIWAESCREVFNMVIPDVKIPMPVHFWRHMFAQHMLRATEWNYSVVAGLGGWTEEALKRSYGMPPQAVITKWGLKYIPQI